MPEIEREQILADRAEELQKIEDRKEIRRLTERNSSDAAGKAIKRDALPLPTSPATKTD
jgi:hypothetical protein